MGEGERGAWVDGIARGAWAEVATDPQDAALCAYAVKLTRTPSEMAESDVEALRAVGLDDVAIHDAVQVIAYFNYINRVADAVDVELEPEYPPKPA